MKVTIRPLKEEDLPAVDIIFRLAAGTLFGVPDPIKFGGDADFVRTRWLADPNAAFVADADDRRAVGSIFASKWGSVAILGPFTVHPNLWDRAIGTRLLEPAMELLDRWGPTHTGLHNLAHSAKHTSLYRKFGFWPRSLIEVMGKDVQETKPDPNLRLYSELSDDKKAGTLEACLEVTESIYVGLDLSREIKIVDEHGLGDTALLYDGDTLIGFAVCHWGAGTEAGSGNCYIKFGVVRKGPNSGEQFKRLLNTCEVLAASRGTSHLIAGVSAARHKACVTMIAHGFKTESVGVAMHKPYKPGYNRNEVFIIDDWR